MEEQQETAGKRVPVSSEKLKALQAAMDKIEKSYGRGAIMKLQIYKEKSQRESETGKETRKRDFGLE